jgi:hypothetical protein
MEAGNQLRLNGEPRWGLSGARTPCALEALAELPRDGRSTRLTGRTKSCPDSRQPRALCTTDLTHDEVLYHA